MPRKNGYETLKTLMLELHKENQTDIKDIRSDVQQLKNNDLHHLHTEVTKINTTFKVYAFIFGGFISIATVILMAIKMFM